jgi:hypothetical protein
MERSQTRIDVMSGEAAAPDFVCSMNPKISNARAIVRSMSTGADGLGFDNRKVTTLLRRTNMKFDVLKFDIVPFGRCENGVSPWVRSAWLQAVYFRFCRALRSARF